MSESNTPADATLGLPRSEEPGGRIGPFKILQQIGEGGFGSVFEAEQEHPVKRRVALKIIKLGMDTREVIARFEAERQALALMDHPHIARVFDAGATETGRPYFVMELVRGEPITAYCTRHGLTIVQRLQLFDQVCSAVQHAHTKGIIHRDLKPSNVLVSTQDDAPFAKVIDFGIAKATSGRLTDRTLFTEANLMMGTPLYMSPEQAEGSADIDTRTDIYSLGVILYQLLTDTTPLGSDSLQAAAYGEVQRIIREVEPPRPSVRLSQSARKQLFGVDTRRAMDPGKLARIVRGELDWIVMKAIEKDRTRRYETANGLAMDVRRYLAGEAVLAAPPSVSYRLRKFVRRNKVPVVAGTLVVLALVAGLVAFAWQAHAARVQERLAQQRSEELEKVSKFQAAMLAQINAAHAGLLLSEDVRDRLASALEKAGVPPAERDRQSAAFAQQWQRINATDTASGVIDQTILRPAIAEIDKQFGAQPLVAASLRQALADCYASLGLYDAALPLQRQALETRSDILGKDNGDTLASLRAMARLAEGRNEYDKAESYFRDLVGRRSRIEGATHPDTIDATTELGVALESEGKFGEAEPYLRTALQEARRTLGADHPVTLRSTNNLAGLMLDESKPKDAEPYLRDALQGFRRTLGNDDPQTITAVNNLGVALWNQGKYAQAEPYVFESLQDSRRIAGEEHPDTLTGIVNMGRLLLDEAEPDKAEPYLREGLEKSRRILGDDNESTLIAIQGMGDLLVAQGKYAEAEKLLGDAEPRMRKAFGEASPARLSLFLLGLGKARTPQGHFADAERDLLDADAILVKVVGPSNRHLRDCIQALTDLYAAWDRAAPGKDHGRQAAEWKARLAVMDASGRKAP